MSHLPPFQVHGYKNRALDVRVVVETEETTANFSALTFHAGGIEKAGLTADDTESGFNVDFTLTAVDLDIEPGLYAAELKGTLAGEVRALARGTLKVDV